MFARFLQRLRAVARYQPWPFLLFYADGKILLDPAYLAVFRELRNARLPLLDLGCGIGLLAAYLRGGGCSAPVLGIDADAWKIGIAAQVLADANARFQVGDARQFPPHSGNVILLDVLHYFDHAEQQRLLRKIAEAVAPGGVALIRVTLNEPTWRFALTKAEEWLIHRVRWIPWAGAHFPTRENVCTPFQEAGFSVDVKPMWGCTPFNGYFFTFRRPAGTP